MLQCSHCSAMNDIVEKVLSSAGHSVDLEAREKVRNYIGLLASTGKTNRQLEHFGKAYLRQILKPDHRYSGL
jgi:hypothetical protein